MTTSPYRTPSKYLIQSCPPDLSESRADARWTFGVYEILDKRLSPVEPKVLHTCYRGAVELAESELPDAADPLYAPKLEDAIISKWKSMLG